MLFGVFVSHLFDKAVGNSCKEVYVAQVAQKAPKVKPKYRPSEHTSGESYKFERAMKRTE